MSHKLKERIVKELITVLDYFVCVVVSDSFTNVLELIVHFFNFLLGVQYYFSGFNNSCFIFTDQARAIHDKVNAGGLCLEGAVGGTKLAAGVAVAQPPHFTGGDDSGESDEDVSYTKQYKLMCAYM